MNKTVVIHQPDFLPYLGFFHRLLHADVFVILDNVQFLREGWQHRDKIKTYNGVKWHNLKITKAPLGTFINDIILVNNYKWINDNLNQIKESYRKAEFFDEIYPYIEKLYLENFTKMIDLNLLSIKILMELFDIEIKIEYSSKYNITTKSNDLVVDILKEVDATHYLSGVGAKDYFEKEPFHNANIEVIWQEFNHPIYPQLHGEFIPYLSSIDLLFNCGIEKSREILRGI
jgi:hypothetical protein